MPYLDHAGAALPSDQQLKAICSLLQNQRLSNPHSRHSTSTITKQIVDNARQRVLSFFNAKDYSIIFTYNATHSLKIVAENFTFSSKMKDSCEMKNSLQSYPSFAYLADSHHSVVGMREIIDYVSCLKSVPEVDEIPDNIGSLFVLTAMSNFCGFKYDLNLIHQLQTKGWSVCLDAAAWVSSSPLDLSQYRPDFVVFSFYKLFGYPTGLGALLVRNDSAHKLQKTYFGGGSIHALLPSQFIVQYKDSLEEKFEDGTINYCSIASLQKGFDDLERFGGIHSISEHTNRIADAAHSMLKDKFHWNGKPAITVYRRGKDKKSQGPIVTFNILREDESFVGYAEVAKMADLFGVDLRTGCFCDIGACQQYLGLSDEDVLENIKAGKRCGDEQDIVNGKPTGAIRVSFGRQSTLQDIDALEQMIDYCFMACRSPPITVPCLHLKSYNPILSKMICYPVKSCRGFFVERATVTPTGLANDRKFMIVQNEITMSQKKYPQLCRISTKIIQNSLVLSAEGMKEITVPLVSPQVNGVGKIVCTNSVSTIDCGETVANWLEKVLEVPGCRLQVAAENSSRSLSNQAPYLLVNEASAQVMSARIGLTLEDIIGRFRPNLVLHGMPAFIEDEIKGLKIGGVEFEVIDKCTRCEMICVNQKTGEKDPRLIVALRDLRDRQKMTFGVYMKQKNCKDEVILTDDVIRFVNND